MFEFVARLFDTTGFLSRTDSGEWSPALIWLHVGGDLFTWLAYLAGPLVVLYFTRRRDRPYSRFFALWVAFLLVAGFGHLVEALTFHYPLYRLSGLLKLLTAVASWATVLALISVLPRVLRAADAAARAGPGAAGDTTLYRLVASPVRERVTDYAVAVLAAVLALLLRTAIEPIAELDDHFYVLSLLAVVFVSWQCGFAPAMVTLLITLFGMAYFFLKPGGSFVVEGLSNQLASAVFFFCGVCCAGLGEAQRAARRGARAALGVALERKADLEVEAARRDEAEEAVRESEGRFRSMADSAPALIWLSDLDRRRTYFNRTWLEFTGRAAEEELGDGWIDNVHSEDRDRYLAAYTEAFETRKPFEIEYQLRRWDGVYRWVLARGTPRFTPSGGFAGFVGLCLDVTDRRRAEEELRRSEKNLADFFENANVGLHWAGPDGAILRANRAELEMLGLAREEYVGRNLAEFHDSPETSDDILGRLARGEQLDNYPARLRHKDGGTRDVLISSTALMEDGKFVHSRCFTRDVTELRRAEEELAERARAAVLRAEAAAALTAEVGLRAALQGCAETLARHTGAGFARVWTADETGEWLELQASAGPDANANGVPARVRVGESEIGRIAQTARPRVTNDVAHAPDVGDLAWAAREGMAAFAGFPLVVEGRVVGVMALFSREKLPDTLTAELAPVADTVAYYIERRRAENELRRSERRFRTLTETIPQMVWNADARGEVTYFNRRWQEYTGIPVEEAAGRGWLAAVHPEDVERVHTAWRMTVLNAPRGTDRFAHEFRLRHAGDESYRWMLSVAVPLTRPDDTVDQWIGSIADIDDQKRAAEHLERVVRQRTAELQTVNGVLVEEIEERKRVEQQVRSVAAELARSNAELEQFAYVASHDLQEPLRKIQAFGDRLVTRVREHLPDAGKEYIDRMLTSAGRMRQLIDDLLTFSRVTSQARPFSRVDLGSMTREVAADLSERVEESGGEVRVGEMPVIDADPSQLRQLMQNLIANALKFQRPGVPPVVEVTGELIAKSSASGDIPANPERQRRGEGEVSSDLTSPLAGEVAAQRRVGGETHAHSQPHPPPGSQSLADLPLKGGGESNEPTITANPRDPVSPGGEAPPPSPARGEGSSSPPATVCRIAVRDNGIGFDEKYLDRIFQVFQRLHGRDEYEGTGVGLAICRKIVERHGGTITARSRVGEGSTFVVTLPVRQPYPADAPVHEPKG